MVQLTLFVVPCSVLLMVGLILSNYWLSLVAGSLGTFLIIALIVKIGRIDKEKIDTTWTTKKRAELEHQIKE